MSSSIDILLVKLVINDDVIIAQEAWQLSCHATCANMTSFLINKFEKNRGFLTYVSIWFLVTVAADLLVYIEPVGAIYWVCWGLWPE